MIETKQQASPPSGLGLIELLITLACMGILLTWGWPHYQAYLQRNQRSQARALLMQTALWMERSASANGQYPLSNNIPANLMVSPQLRYQLQVTSSVDTYTLMAIPTGVQLDDPCGTLILNHTGVRSIRNNDVVYDANTCWQR